MTVSQAKEIDSKFVRLKDSVKMLSACLEENKGILKTTSEDLVKTKEDLSVTHGQLNEVLMSNSIYIKEIQKYKKMEFEDRKVLKRTTVGFIAAGVVWVFIVAASLIN